MLLEVFFGFSILLNLVFLGLIIYLYKYKLKDKSPTYDCKQLINDLTKGSALVKIELVDSSDLFLRRL